MADIYWILPLECDRERQIFQSKNVARANPESILGSLQHIEDRQENMSIFIVDIFIFTRWKYILFIIMELI